MALVVRGALNRFSLIVKFWLSHEIILRGFATLFNHFLFSSNFFAWFFFHLLILFSKKQKEKMEKQKKTSLHSTTKIEFSRLLRMFPIRSCWMFIAIIIFHFMASVSLWLVALTLATIHAKERHSNVDEATYNCWREKKDSYVQSQCTTKMIIIIIITTNHILCQDTHTHNLKLNKTQNQDLIVVKQRLYSLGVFLPLHSYTIEHSMMRSSLTSVQPTI